MRGLILKDFLNLKKNIRIFLAIFVVYGVLAFISDDSSFFSTVLTIIFAVLVLSLYSYDEMAKWDGYALTMPITRDNMVQVKYVMMLLLTFIGAIFGITFAFLMNITSMKFDLILKSIINCGIGTSIVILFYCVTIPFITKLGVEKARLIFFVVYLVPFIITIAVNKSIKSGQLTIPQNLVDMVSAIAKYAYVLLPLFVLLALSVSYTISLSIYRKKEF